MAGFLGSDKLGLTSPLCTFSNQFQLAGCWCRVLCTLGLFRVWILSGKYNGGGRGIECVFEGKDRGMDMNSELGSWEVRT